MDMNKYEECFFASWEAGDTAEDVKAEIMQENISEDEAEEAAEDFITYCQEMDKYVESDAVKIVKSGLYDLDDLSDIKTFYDEWQIPSPEYIRRVRKIAKTINN